jgi:hypothetical protein
VKRTALFAAALLLPLHMTVAAAGDAAKPSIEERLIVANVGGKCGFVNERGKLVIPATYDSVSPFYPDGLASVYDEKTKSVYFIDKTGKISFFGPQGAWISDWDRTDQYIQVDNGYKTGFIDRKGKLVIPMVWDEAKSFNSSNLAPVKKSGFWGYINRSGTLVIPTIFSSAYSFKNGQAEVNFQYYPYTLAEDGVLRPADKKEPASSRYVNPQTLPVGALYYQSEPNAVGVSTAHIKTSGEPNLVLASKDGKVIGRQFSHIYLDSDPSLYAAKIGDEYGKSPTKVSYGFINTMGETALPFVYDSAQGFNGGQSAIVSQKGKWGLIDRKGKWLIKPKYQRLGECQEPSVRLERQ